MGFDGTVVYALKKSLQKELIGARAERVFQPQKDTIVIKLRSEKNTKKLLLSANASSPRIHLTEAVFENPPQPPSFCMLLRKYLEGSRLVEVEQPDLERQLKLYFKGYNEIGEEKVWQLTLEIMGKHSNLILIDPSTQIIIDGIKRYNSEVNRYREVMPGKPYLPPPPQDKKDFRQVSEEEFAAILLAAEPQQKIEKVIMNSFAGLGPTLSREIIFRSGLDEGILINDCGAYELSLIYQQMKEIFSALEQEKFSPCLISSFDQKYIDFAAFTLTQYPQELRQEYGDINSALDEYFSSTEKRRIFQQKQEKLLRLLKKESERCQKKIEIHRQTIEESQDKDELRLKGEIITANIFRLKKGDTLLRGENFYQNPPSLIEIELDPALTPAENAQKYFKKYDKAKRSALKAQEQLQQSEEELYYLLSVLTYIELAKSGEELKEIEEELKATGYFKAKDKPLSSKKKEKSSFLSFLSSDGFEILVGRNNRQNDYLTLKVAKKDDLWLHTQKIPGAHVIIRSQGKEIPPATLEEAASLAAYYSRARNSSKVAVDYTQVKNVYKPKGARPGMVLYKEQNTVYVEPVLKLDPFKG